MSTARSSNLVALPISFIPHSSSPSPSPSPSTSPPSPPPLSIIFSAWLEVHGRVSRIHLFLLHPSALYKSSETVTELLRLNDRAAGSDGEKALCDAINRLWKRDHQELTFELRQGRDGQQSNLHVRKKGSIVVNIPVNVTVRHQQPHAAHKELLQLTSMVFAQTRAKVASDEAALEALEQLIAERMTRVQRKVREKEWLEEDILQCFHLLAKAKRDEVARCDAEYARLLAEKDALLHPKPPARRPTPPKKEEGAAKKARQRKAPVKRNRGKKAAADEHEEEEKRKDEAEEQEEKTVEEGEQKTREMSSPEVSEQAGAAAPLLSPLLSDKDLLEDGHSHRASEAGLEHKYDDDDDGDDEHDADLVLSEPLPPLPSPPSAAPSPASSSFPLRRAEASQPELKTRRELTPQLSTSVSALTSSVTASSSSSTSPSQMPAPSSLLALATDVGDSLEQAAAKKPKRSLASG